MRAWLCALIIAISTPALAAWEKVSENDGLTHYIDRATAKGRGNFRTVLELQGLDARGDGGEMSRRALDQYDYRRKRRRLLYLTTHTGLMARGRDLVTVSEADSWSHVQNETPAAIILTIVCAE